MTQAVPLILDAFVLTGYLKTLTSEEAFDFHHYAGMEGPEKYCERATAWLVAKGKVVELPARGVR